MVAEVIGLVENIHIQSGNQLSSIYFPALNHSTNLHLS